MLLASEIVNNITHKLNVHFKTTFNLENSVCVCVRVNVLSHFSRVWLFVTLWTVNCQAPLSMGFSRQGYWRGLPCPPPGDLPDPRIEAVPLTSPTLAGVSFTTSATWEAHVCVYVPMNDFQHLAPKCKTHLSICQLDISSMMSLGIQCQKNNLDPSAKPHPLQSFLFQ